MTALAANIRRLRREEYDRLVESGAFEGEHVELLEGLVIEMTPHGPEHDGTIDDLNALFSKAVAGRAMVRIQSAFVASESSEPEPDVALVPVASYRRAHPARAFLIVEVARSSLERDRAKAATYAAAGVPEYWIVDLVHSTVEVYRRPVGDRYEQVSTHRSPEILHPDAFADVEVPLAIVLAV